MGVYTVHVLSFTYKIYKHHQNTLVAFFPPKPKRDQAMQNPPSPPPLGHPPFILPCKTTISKDAKTTLYVILAISLFSLFFFLSLSSSSSTSANTELTRSSSRQTKPTRSSSPTPTLNPSLIPSPTSSPDPSEIWRAFVLRGDGKQG
jgi:hypothetical protein